MSTVFVKRIDDRWLCGTIVTANTGVEWFVWRFVESIGGCSPIEQVHSNYFGV